MPTQRQGRRDEAFAACREAIRLEPRHAEAHAAIAACRDAIRLGPDSAEVIRICAMLYEQGKSAPSIGPHRAVIGAFQRTA